MRKKSGNIASKFAAPFSFEMKKRGFRRNVLLHFSNVNVHEHGHGDADAHDCSCSFACPIRTGTKLPPLIESAQKGLATRTSFDLKRGAHELPAFLFAFGIKEEFT